MGNAWLRHFFESLNSLTVLVVGDAMLDHYVWGDVTGLSPEAPVPRVHVKKKDYRMGGASNVALNIRALGAKPILCTIIGEDVAGNQLLRCINEHNLTDEGIVVSKNRSTTTKTRVIADQRHVVRIDDESDYKNDLDKESELWRRMEKLLPRCNVVIIEDYDKGVITPALIDKTVALSKKANIPVVVDPKKNNFLSYKGVTLIKPNLKELREGLGMTIEEGNESELTKAVEILKKKLTTNVLVTLSANGVFVDYESKKIALPAHKYNIVDVSGAGDTVISIAALCVAQNSSPKFMASLSNLGGGLVCRYTGVVPIDREELWNAAIEVVNDEN